MDLGGKTMQPRGGYDKEHYGLTWTEHPHAHWHMNFMCGNTSIRNGTIVLIDRLALNIEGPAVVLDNVSFEGMATGVHTSWSTVGTIWNAASCSAGMLLHTRLLSRL